MIIHGTAPFNAEPPLDRLRAAFFTEAPDFYVRCHGDIPALDDHTHRLRIGGDVLRHLDLSMADLRALAPAHDVTAVLQCAGNRRADLQSTAPTTGDPWDAGAIGHARWTGIPLARALEAAGARPDPALHVAFEAADRSDTIPFGVSIPITKALDPSVLLAWSMNGRPLTPEHGHPLRLLVPGYAGVRSPKWLASITVQDHPSDNPMQATDYRLFPPDITADTADWSRGIVIDEMPLNAAICEPARDARLLAGPVTIRGYAVASGRPVTEVEVSVDAGQNWQRAELEPCTGPWSWTFWHCRADLPAGHHELVVRAHDTAGQIQPHDPASIWNFKGYLCNSWHRITVRAVG